MNGYITLIRIFYVLICIVFVVRLVVRLFVGLFLVRHVLNRFNVVQHQRLKQVGKKK